LVDRFAPVAGLGNDSHVALTFNHSHQTFADYRMIISNHERARFELDLRREQAAFLMHGRIYRVAPAIRSLGGEPFLLIVFAQSVIDR
jgi:hypothetical protein